MEEYLNNLIHTLSYSSVNHIACQGQQSKILMERNPRD